MENNLGEKKDVLQRGALWFSNTTEKHIPLLCLSSWSITFISSSANIVLCAAVDISCAAFFLTFPSPLDRTVTLGPPGPQCLTEKNTSRGCLWFWTAYHPFRASLVAQRVKNLPAMRETQVWSLGQEYPLEKEMQSTPVFSPGKSHGQRSLMGYSLWGLKESDTTEQLTLSLSPSIHPPMSNNIDFSLENHLSLHSLSPWSETGLRALHTTAWPGQSGLQWLADPMRPREIRSWNFPGTMQRCIVFQSKVDI